MQNPLASLFMHNFKFFNTNNLPTHPAVSFHFKLSLFHPLTFHKTIFCICSYDLGNPFLIFFSHSLLGSTSPFHILLSHLLFPLLIPHPNIKKSNVAWTLSFCKQTHTFQFDTRGHAQLFFPAGSFIPVYSHSLYDYLASCNHLFTFHYSFQKFQLSFRNCCIIYIQV